MREIPLRQGYVALVDDDDWELLSSHKWSISSQKRYPQTSITISRRKSKTTYMHQLLMPKRPGLWTDHINGDGFDNRHVNLRYATWSQNRANTGKESINKSGFKGVSWKSDRGKWVAQLGTQGQRRHIGYFTDPESAARAYDAAAIRLHGEFARLNFTEAAVLSNRETLALGEVT